MQLLLTLTLTLLLSSVAFAKVPGLRCDRSDVHDQVFDKFVNLSDGQIEKDCFHDRKIWAPNSNDQQLRSNERRISRCERDHQEMRRLAKEYKDAKSKFCQEAQAQESQCRDSRNQRKCMQEAAAKTKAGSEEMEKIAKISKESIGILDWLKGLKRLAGKKLKENKEKLDRAYSRASAPERRRIEQSTSFPQTPASPVNNKGKTGEGAGRTAAKIEGKSADPTANQGLRAPTTPSSPAGSDISGVIDARKEGARTIGEYRQRLPYLIEETVKTQARIEELSASFQKAEVRHREAAATMAIAAAKTFAAAKSLDMAGQELSNPRLDQALVEESDGAAPALALAQGPTGATELTATEENSLSMAEKAQATPPKPLKSKSPVLSLPIASDSQVTPSERSAKIDDDAPLDSFEGRLVSNTGLSKTERAKALKERLKRRLAGLPEDDNEPKLEDESKLSSQGPKSLVSDLIQKQRELAPSTKARYPYPGVDEAVADIEAQVAELLRSIGILGSESEDLFVRVRTAHARSLKAGLVE